MCIGKEELNHAHVSEKVGFVISKIETLSYLTILDLETMDGKIILNIKNRSGKILASYREIPVVCLDEAKKLKQKIMERGIGGILLIGQPNSPLLGVPVGIDKVGMIIVGGG